MESVQINNKSIFVGLRPKEINGKKIAMLHHPSGSRWHLNKPEFKKNWYKIIYAIKSEIQKILCV